MTTALPRAERPRSVYLKRNFVLSYGASFISLFGSKLLMMSYVAYIYQESGSAKLASVVFAADWLSNLVIGLFGAQYIDRSDVKRLLVRVNVVAALVTLSFAAVSAPRYFHFAVIVIFVRALLSSTVSSCRVKALVQFFTKEETDTYSPVFNSSLFIAMALAGGVGIYILRFVGFTTIVYIDAATFLVAAVMFAMVRPNAERQRESMRTSAPVVGRAEHIRTAFGIIARNVDLATAVFYIILSVTAFQATYEILMTIVPQVWFGMGRSGTALYFTLESIAVTAGVFLYQFLSRRGVVTAANQRRLNVAVVVFSTAVYLAMPLARGRLYVCTALFVVLVLAVELVWTHQFKQMIANIPDAKVAAVVGVQTAMGYTLMGVFAISFSSAVDRWGIAPTVYLNICLLALLVGGWELLTRARTADATRERELALTLLERA